MQKPLKLAQKSKVSEGKAQMTVSMLACVCQKTACGKVIQAISENTMWPKGPLSIIQCKNLQIFRTCAKFPIAWTYIEMTGFSLKFALTGKSEGIVDSTNTGKDGPVRTINSYSRKK